uniref:Uncharacterized protein n=1 Tax=Ralstonia syzygii R24 TaxID=907261 RepID=G3AC58_9RALS|nr:hypothetical protein RALSY_mp30452 [Ralstonia syzygii R24]
MGVLLWVEPVRESIELLFGYEQPVAPRSETMHHCSWGKTIKSRQQNRSTNRPQMTAQARVSKAR